jgi:hypothetical protein
MTGHQDQDRAARLVDELVRRPLTRAQRRQVDRAAGAAAILARRLQQQATRQGRTR